MRLDGVQQALAEAFPELQNMDASKDGTGVASAAAAAAAGNEADAAAGMSGATTTAATAATESGVGSPAAPASTSTAAGAGAKSEPSPTSQDYGAATASLTDPACIRGTQEFAAAKADNDARLTEYNRVLQTITVRSVCTLLPRMSRVPRTLS